MINELYSQMVLFTNEKSQGIFEIDDRKKEYFNKIK